MKKISCSFANHSGAEIGININGENFIIPGNSVGASLFTKEINPGAVADIQAWLTANHPYVVFTNNGDGVTDENELFVPNSYYPKGQDGESITLPSKSQLLPMLTATGGWDAITLPGGVDSKAVMIQVHNGVASDYTSYKAEPPGFKLSFNGGTDWIECVGSFAFDQVQPGGVVLCSVSAALGNKIAVFISA